MGVISRYLLAAVIAACCWHAPGDSTAKVTKDFVATGARLLEADGKPAIIFKGWYRQDPAASSDFLFAHCMTSTPDGIQDWRISSLDENVRISNQALELGYEAIGACMIEDSPAVVQYCWDLGRNDWQYYVRFAQAKTPSPASPADWAITQFPYCEYDNWARMNLTTVDGRPASAFKYGHLSLAWASIARPAGRDDWEFNTIAPLAGSLQSSFVFDFCGSPLVVYCAAGNLDSSTATSYMFYSAEFEPAAATWRITELFENKYHWKWSAGLIDGFLYIIHQQGSGGITCACAPAEDAQEAGAWRQTLVHPNAAIASDVASLQGRPAIACFSNDALIVACAAVNPPAGPEDWIWSRVQKGYCKDVSLASIQGKPCAAYVDYKGGLGRLVIACATTPTPQSARDWRISTVFAGWDGAPNKPGRTPAPAPSALAPQQLINAGLGILLLSTFAFLIFVITRRPARA
jgi:hypothetical protein